MVFEGSINTAGINLTNTKEIRSRWKQTFGPKSNKRERGSSRKRPVNNGALKWLKSCETIREAPGN